MAAALGVRVVTTSTMIIIGAVGIIASATTFTGPIVFVLFLSGPISAQLVSNNGLLLISSTLVGALLVLARDYIGEFLLPSQHPVGVVTGPLGALYLTLKIVRVNRTGGSL